jgi:hypothetical protein
VNFLHRLNDFGFPRYGGEELEELSFSCIVLHELPKYIQANVFNTISLIRFLPQKGLNLKNTYDTVFFSGTRTHQSPWGDLPASWHVRIKLVCLTSAISGFPTQLFDSGD